MLPFWARSVPDRERGKYSGAPDVWTRKKYFHRQSDPQEKVCSPLRYAPVVCKWTVKEGNKKNEMEICN